MSDKLNQIRAVLEAGNENQVFSLKELLSWFDAKRRGYWIVREIREELASANLITEPDFEDVWWGGNVEFELRSDDETGEEAASSEKKSASDQAEVQDGDGVWISREAAYRISRLEAANKGVVSATSNETIPSVITKMLKGGFSQLPVMNGEHEIKGVVSWQSIGSRNALGVTGDCAKDFQDKHFEIDNDRSIFDAIPIILAHDYVFVRNSTDKKVTGIVTAVDLSMQFRELTEPFLIISEIENTLRNIIGENFSIEELKKACNPEDTARSDKIESAANLSFGEYVRLIDNDERWKKIGLNLDRRVFCEDLKEINDVRNMVMHFDPDGVDSEEMEKLTQFCDFLRSTSTLERVNK